MEEAAADEAGYNLRGYLAPPRPPDETERRRALYKFNIWRTGPDSNFDRISHLTRLVFNTKMVLISLIDSDEQCVFILSRPYAFSVILSTQSLSLNRRRAHLQMVKIFV